MYLLKNEKLGPPFQGQVTGMTPGNLMPLLNVCYADTQLCTGDLACFVSLPDHKGVHNFS